jgi:hypothetical protein
MQEKLLHGRTSRMKFQRCISPAATREQVSPDSLRRFAIKRFWVLVNILLFLERNVKIAGFAATILTQFVLSVVLSLPVELMS